jgi:large subunit ribosomal protein L6
MSRIGKKPIPVPSSVKVAVAGATVKVEGPKGKLSWTLPQPITAKVESGHVTIDRPDDGGNNKALHGLSRALVANMVQGCAEGYSRSLEIYGTGYGANVEGKNLLLNIGFMGRATAGRKAQFVIPIPEGLAIKVETPTARGNSEPAKFTVSGPDKQQVNQFAAEIRKLRKPEPYLGKGIRYAGEQIRRKAGKVFAGGGGG